MAHSDMVYDVSDSSRVVIAPLILESLMSATETAPSSTPHVRLTAKDLLAMPNERDYELVGGQLVCLNGGFDSSHVSGEMFGRLYTHVKAHGLGWVLPIDAGYQCFPRDPDKVRKPDVSFIRAARLKLADRPKGYCRIHPDLVVEVISPNDLAIELSKKVEDYLEAGVPLVWVLDPESQRVFIYRRTGSDAILSRHDELTGEEVVPGFHCQVSELFADPPGVS